MSQRECMVTLQVVMFLGSHPVQSLLKSSPFIPLFLAANTTTTTVVV